MKGKTYIEFLLYTCYVFTLIFSTTKL